MSKLVAAGMIAGAMLLAASPAAAQSWRMAGYGGQAPDRSVYIVDTDSISRIGDTVRFKTSTIWEIFEPDRDFNRSITQREGSCATKSSAIVTNNFYADGKLVSQQTTRGQMVTHGANSLMRAVMDAVCGDDSYETDVLVDAEATVRAWLKNTP